MEYIHGYTEEEQERLNEQADFLGQMIYEDLDFSEVNHLLEIGCGTGAQTKILLQKNAEMTIEACDISEAQLSAAGNNLKGENKVNLHLLGDGAWPFEDNTFDCVFFCWVLEHVQDCSQILREVNRVLKPGGKIIMTEVYNRSFQLLPSSEEMEQYWSAYNELQLEMGGDPNVGIKLGNYLQSEGFIEIQSKPLYAHRDQRNPQELLGILNYWEDLILSGKDQLIEAGKVDSALIERLKKRFEAYRNNKETIFFYTGIQASAKKE